MPALRVWQIVHDDRKVRIDGRDAIHPHHGLSGVGDTELTLRGWYTAAPDDEPRSSTCEPLPEREAFCGFGWDMLRPIEAPIFGGADHLPWIVDSAAGLLDPDADQWITIRGRFDHPAAERCYGGDIHGVLSCRLEFVVNSISEG